MPVCGAYIVPHPPLIISEIGKGQEQQVRKTIESYHTIARHITKLRPETVVVFSPHAPTDSDYIHVLSGQQFRGGLPQFGLKHTYIAEMDCDLSEAICNLCSLERFPAGYTDFIDKNYDHGTIVPLHFIRQHYSDFKLVSIAVSGLSRQDHFQFGKLLDQAIRMTGRRVVLVASGDLSHRLKEDGPYGFVPEGPQLDARLTEAIKTANFENILEIPEKLCEQGAQCGLMSFLMMAGAMNGLDVRPDFLSYEDVTGVGYAVCIYEILNGDETDNACDSVMPEASNPVGNKEHILVWLARHTLEEYVRKGTVFDPPEELPTEYLQNRAGVFVSYKKNGELRGCIGTIEPTQKNIALEVVYNAISSGTRDPRFEPVHPDELDSLTCSVDILSKPEPIYHRSQLDTQRYGVIVTSGSRRGLLLPRLEGIETVEEQISVACRKAGIRAKEPYSLERFEVVRYT